MNAPTPQVDVARVCPQCGAQYYPDAGKCWLCHADLSDEPLVVAQLIAPPPSPVWKLSEVFFASLSALTALLVVLIGIGIFAQEATLGVIYVILVLPPLTVTVARTYRKTQSGAGISWAERFATFLVSSVVMMGVLGILAVAAVACLIIMCFMNPPSFH